MLSEAIKTNTEQTATFENPVSSGWSKKQIEDFATRVAAHFSFTEKSDPTELVSTLGGNVNRVPMSEKDDVSSGWIVVNDIGNFQILLNRDTVGERQRFTIAHELGHYFLHYVNRRVNDESPAFCMMAKFGKMDDNLKAEYEANWFALTFLMPEEKFKAVYKKQDGNLPYVAAYFGVPLWIADVRRKSLELDETEAEVANVSFNEHIHEHSLALN